MTVVRTDNVAAPYRERFAAERGHLPGAGLPWVRELREEGIALFGELGFPTPRLEEWKYTNLLPLTRTTFRAPERERGSALSERDLAPFLLDEGRDGGAVSPRRLVFVEGRFRPDLSDLGPLPEGVRVLPLAEALEREPAVAEPFLGRLADAEGRALVALNNAFFADGAIVLLRDGAALEEPLHLVFVGTGQGEPVVTHPRVLIQAGRGSQATIVQSYLGLGPDPYWTNAVVEAAVADDALIRFYTLQQEGAGAFHTAAVRVVQGKDSRFHSCSLDVGGALARRDLDALLDGPQIDCDLDGAYMVRGRQHVDNHTFVEHAKPNCRSRQVFKGVLDDRGHAVFNGKILVHRAAQKTDGHQLNRNLLLSPTAQADTKPELFIYADDVKCSHGATVGELDEQPLFYLRSRGLSVELARSILTAAFINEVIDDIEVTPVRRRFRNVVLSWLPPVPGGITRVVHDDKREVA